MNKLGLHIIGGWRGQFGQPRVVKLVNCSVEYKREVRAQVGRDCLIIWRRIEPDQALDNPVQRARDWFTARVGEMRAWAEDDDNVLFESLNEIAANPGDLETSRLYAAFELERMRLMEAEGLRCVIGNWSPGQPHESLWPEVFKPLLDAMQPGDFVGVHEYWSREQPLNDRWHCGRWTVIPELQGVPIVVTECGRGDGGWRGKISPEEYLQELERYHAILDASPNVLGAVVFSTLGPAQGWATFDPSEIWPQVVGRYTGADWTDPSMSAPPPSHALGPDPSVAYYHSSRHGYEPEWIILHDTEGPAEAALAWWRSPDNPYKSSAHYLIKADGEVIVCVPEHLSAHHAGGGKWDGIPEGSTGGTSNINHVSIGVELEYPKAPASPPWPGAQLKAAAELLWHIANRHGIPRERVLRHSDVLPGIKFDPRNFDWEGFLNRIWPPEPAPEPDEEAIRRAAWNVRNIPYNPEAAFPRYAREHGLGNPVTAEVDVGDVRLQGFSGGIVYARIGDWGNCSHIAW